MIEENFVVPGDMLGVIEEFIPSDNAYVHSGDVRAKIVGRPSVDINKHEAGVTRAKEVPVPREGDVVQAVVTLVRDAVVHVDIFYNETKKTSYAIPFRGVIHISEASNEGLRSFYGVFGYGDVVRAKVLTGKPPYMLSTRGPDYGLIVARCPRCMALLKKKGLWLYCSNCRKTFRKRKVSRLYMMR